MARLLPILIAIIAIAALTVVEGNLTERWGDNRHCGYCATLLDEVPKQIGDWSGTDGEVEELVQEAAGARGFVSRSYTNEGTGKTVGVWFIVGHARDTARHTPDICYIGSGFKKDKPPEGHTLNVGGDEVEFKTALFVKSSPLGTRQERVFWTWFKPEAGSQAPVAWQAPDNQRLAFGAAPALYKLYFTASGRDSEAIDDSVCMEFAREFLPVVEPIVKQANEAIPDDYVAPEGDA